MYLSGVYFKYGRHCCVKGQQLLEVCITLRYLKFVSNIFDLPHIYISQYGDRASDWTTDEVRFDSRQGQQYLLFAKASRPAPGPTGRCRRR
jgi:hypothetical protein